MNASTLVQKLWNYCNILRDDGLSYGDCEEQLTFLLFLKMAHEKTEAPFFQRPVIDAERSWPKLLELDADDLEVALPPHARSARQGRRRDRRHPSARRRTRSRTRQS
ncbi:MAG: type I restriction-modification system subunit M N-terminal domain-containing protein [Caldimonas sp.]